MTKRTYDSIAAEYRSEFPYLSDLRYELLCISADENYDGDYDENPEEALDSFARTLDSYSQDKESAIYASGANRDI